MNFYLLFKNYPRDKHPLFLSLAKIFYTGLLIFIAGFCIISLVRRNAGVMEWQTCLTQNQVSSDVPVQVRPPAPSENPESLDLSGFSGFFFVFFGEGFSATGTISKRMIHSYENERGKYGQSFLQGKCNCILIQALQHVEK